MSDLFKNTPINKFDKTNPAYLRTRETAKVSRRMYKGSKWLKIKEKEFSSLTLLYAFVMDLLGVNAEDPGSVDLSHLPPGEREFYALFDGFSGLLTELGASDKIKDHDFLKKLSSSWNFILLSVKRREGLKPPCPYLDLLEETVDAIESFGPKDGEPLGYYLQSHKEQDWFPIPYLQLLTLLHDDHKGDKSNSIISKWQELISALLLTVLSAKD